MVIDTLDALHVHCRHLIANQAPSFRCGEERRPDQVIKYTTIGGTQQTRHIDIMLDQLWDRGADAGPALS